MEILAHRTLEASLGYDILSLVAVLVGLAQYLNSTLQFLIAVCAFGETFTPRHQIAMSLIWTGLVLYTLQAVRDEHASRRARRKSSTVSQT